MKWLATLLVSCIPIISDGAERCSPPEGFSTFFARYDVDPAFQNVRIASTVQFARAVDAGGPQERIERINISDKVFLDRYGAFPDAQIRIREGLEIREGPITNSSATIKVGAPDSDSFLRIYKFKRVNGCWILRAVDDVSL